MTVGREAGKYCMATSPAGQCGCDLQPRHTGPHACLGYVSASDDGSTIEHDGHEWPDRHQVAQA